MKVVETFGACSRSIYVQLTKKKQAYVYIHAFYIAACKVRSTCVVWDLSLCRVTCSGDF